MRNLWFIFIGIIIVLMLFFTSFIDFSFDNLQKKSAPLNTQISTTQKATNEKHPSTITVTPTSTKENTQSTIQKIALSEDEQVYEEEIAEAYSEDNEVKPIQKSHLKTITLTATGAVKVKMKIKAKERNGLVKAKVSITHNMLTYAQAKKKGLEVNFITHISARIGQRVVYDASTSQFLSKNPLIKFSFKGKKGEELTVIYRQLKGETFYDAKKIK